MTARTYVPGAQGSVRPPDLGPTQRQALRASDPAPPGPRRGRLELVAMIALAVVLALGIKTYLVQAFFIPSGSMIPTLEVGDRVLVEKISVRFRDPRRGEVVVFERPGADKRGGLIQTGREFLQGLGLVQPDADIDLIKRVIALPGETVSISDGVVTVDGRRLDEPYIRPDLRDYGPFTVPAGSYFMMGDNRSNSDDSRHSLGPVPRENIVGRAFVIMWPPWNFTLGVTADPIAGSP